MVTLSLSQFRLLSRALDREIGIIEQVSPIPLQPSEGPLHFGVAVMQNPSAISAYTRLSPLPRMDRQSAGAGETFIGALWSTVGEGLERYAAGLVDPRRVTVARAEQLDGPAVDPRRFIRFSAEQEAAPDYPFLRYDDETALGWTKATRAIDGAEWWVPSDFVWIHHAGGAPQRLDRGYSTGLGAHTKPACAAATAIKELVERDSYITRFLLNAAPPRVAQDRVLACLDPAVARYLGEGWMDIRVFDITNDFGIPTALCHIMAGPGKGIASGASCAITSEAAISKAVVECLHTFNWLIDMDRWGQKADRSAIDDFVDHVSYHRDDKAAARYLPFLSAGESDAIFARKSLSAKPDEELRDIVGRLEAAGYPVFLADITPSDVSSLGFHVIRAVIPGLQPIFAGLGSQQLDDRRLKQVAGHLGLAWDEVRINQEPHPFP